MAALNVSASQTVLFLHIPKTGGTSFQSILGQEFSPEAIFDVRNAAQVRAFCALPAEQRQRIRLVSGHMGFGLHAFCAGPTTYLTILREPVARVISTYDYIRRTPAHNHYARVMAGAMSLADFVREGVSKAGVDNGQTRLLSGAPNGGDSIGFRECTRDLLEQAKVNLTTCFTVVGLLEQFDASLLLAQAAFGWKTHYYVAQNITEGRETRAQISKADLALIAEYNQLDLELYAFAQTLFQQQVRRQGPLFPLRVKAFTWRNRRQRAS